MAHVPKAPFQGRVLIDATSVQTHLFDLPPGATRSLKRVQDGLEGVLEELPVALGQHAKTLGIDIEVLTRITTTTDVIDALRALNAESHKLTEILSESLAYHEDGREADFSLLAAAVKRGTVRRDPAIKASFEKLLAYVAQVGVKAAATRRKNEAADAGGDTPDNDDVTSP